MSLWSLHLRVWPRQYCDTKYDISEESDISTRLICLMSSQKVWKLPLNSYLRTLHFSQSWDVPLGNSCIGLWTDRYNRCRDSEEEVALFYWNDICKSWFYSHSQLLSSKKLAVIRYTYCLATNHSIMKHQVFVQFDKTVSVSLTIQLIVKEMPNRAKDDLRLRFFLTNDVPTRAAQIADTVGVL